MSCGTVSHFSGCEGKHEKNEILRHMTLDDRIPTASQHHSMIILIALFLVVSYEDDDNTSNIVLFSDFEGYTETGGLYDNEEDFIEHIINPFANVFINDVVPKTSVLTKVVVATKIEDIPDESVVFVIEGGIPRWYKPNHSWLNAFASKKQSSTFIPLQYSSRVHNEALECEYEIIGVDGVVITVPRIPRFSTTPRSLQKWEYYQENVMLCVDMVDAYIKK